MERNALCIDFPITVVGANETAAGDRIVLLEGWAPTVAPSLPLPPKPDPTK